MGEQWKIAKRTEYGGRWYQSKKEANYAAGLDLLKNAKGRDRVREWTPQVSLKLVVNGELICRYRLDFEIIYEDGRTELVETKGHQTAIWKLKWKLAKALYPDRTFVLVAK